MKGLNLNPSYQLYEKNGKPFCSSRQIAETFEKRHDHVLRDIRETGEVVTKLKPQFWGANFIEVKYKERGRIYPEFLLSKDGFAYLAMGFTGDKAAEFKLAYIERFNQMESFIQSLFMAKMEHPAFTEAVMLAHDEPKHYHFSNEADMINRLVLGMSAKQFREANGIEKGSSIRPFLTDQQIKEVETLQRADIGILATGVSFEERKRVLGRFLDRKRMAIAAAV